MTDDARSEMLMYMSATGGGGLKGESQLNVLGGGTLMPEFTRGQFFEVENFTFGMNLMDDEGGDELDGSEKGSYARWRGLTDATAKPKPPFRAEPTEVSVSRKIDISSPILLQHCLNTQEFEKVVLVKRARAGTASYMIVVLRLEFNKVWLSEIDWEDGDTVRETVKFKFAGMTATYVKQMADGKPGPSASCSWTAYQRSKP